MDIVMLPTPQVVLAAARLSEACGRYLRARSTLPDTFGAWEANVEALNLTYLVIRHVEAITELAQKDLVLIPTATLAARAAFEASVRTRWLLLPDDSFDREARYLAHLAGEEVAIRRLSDLLPRTE